MRIYVPREKIYCPICGGLIYFHYHQSMCSIEVECTGCKKSMLFPRQQNNLVRCAKEAFEFYCHEVIENNFYGIMPTKWYERVSELKGFPEYDELEN